MAEDNFTVSRQFAAEILNVSVRTLDRYSKKDKITSSRRGRKLFFDEKELLDFKAKIMAEEQYEQIQRSREQKKVQEAHRAGAFRKTGTTRKAGASRRAVGNRNKDVNRGVPLDFIDVQEAQVIEQESYDDMDGEFANIRDSLLRRSPEESIFKKLFHRVLAPACFVKYYLSSH